jgi:RNA polymerase sigma-70 factor (ECF subfamily)
MNVDDAILKGCMEGKREAQKLLYQAYASTMMAVCLRYVQHRDEAEDIVQEGFLKVFQSIRSFRNEGSLEGWIKRIMINHSLNHYKKSRRTPFLEDIDSINEREIVSVDEPVAFNSPVSHERLLLLIQSLPPGYRIVFNLYAFEEYSHKEIAKELNISENTSKTQLLKARRMLRNKIEELKEIKNRAIANER